jgi:hypothetical protein
MPKKSFLDSIEVKTPCSQSWSEMAGNEQVRFCSHCAKDVHNLSEMTRREARKIVAKSKGGICVQYIRRPDGRIQTANQKLYKIANRASRLAAGVFSASLSFSTAVYAQSSIAETELPTSAHSVHQIDETQQTDNALGAIEITVKDPNGAVIPNISVTVKNSKTNESQTLASNDEGFLQLKNIAAGTYEINAQGNFGFVSSRIEDVKITEGKTTSLDVQMEVGGAVTVGGAVAMVSYENPLVMAVYEEDIELVRELIRKGADVNARETDKMTALHAAVESGNVEIVRILLQTGAKVNARTDSRRTPLMMLDGDAKPELVNLLLKHGAKVTALDDGKSTVLINAANFNVPAEVLQILIGAGAKVDAQNNEGRTALMEAAYEENLEAVKTLLEAGAKVDLRDDEGKTALQLTDTEEIRKLLIAYGAVKETTDDNLNQ